MIILAIILLSLAAFVVTVIAGVILNVVRALRGKARPLPKRAYWDPSHPRYREAHTVYISAEPSAQC
jgi:hypothetical protein